MHADLKGTLAQINRYWRAFEHRGQSMSKEEVRAVLTYGIKKGYQTTAELSDEEVDRILEQKRGNDKFTKPSFMESNEFGVNRAEIKVGVKVNTTDGDNGVVEKITTNPFPYFVRFENGGSAWQDLRHIKEVLKE